MLFLEKKVNFQGVEVKLGSIVNNDDVHMLNALDCDSISLLLENKKPSIGIRTEDTIEYYVDRTLQRSRHAKPRFPAQEELKPALNRDILHDMRDTEDNLGSEIATVLKANTLLVGDSRVILVTDEPGMGKSTLLTHLARETRKIHPNMWIVRVNINNYTRKLHELKANGCDQEGVIKLLNEAAQLKETDGVVLEGRLFNYTYNSTGNMAVLIDGGGRSESALH
jgi:predicted nucleic acid-binding protein